MIERYEAGSLSETQDAVCIDLSLTIKERMLATDSKDLLKTTITERCLPNPLIKYEHDMTLYYWLKPFTAHSGLAKPGSQLMTMVHHMGGLYAWEVAGLEIVNVPMEAEGEFIFPNSFSSWDILYRIEEYVGVLTPERTKPTEEQITICRILLEDALTTFAETDTAQTVAA